MFEIVDADGQQTDKDHGYTISSPRAFGSGELKIVKKFQMKVVILTAVKNRCMLQGRVFVMCFLLVQNV